MMSGFAHTELIRSPQRNQEYGDRQDLIIMSIMTVDISGIVVGHAGFLVTLLKHLGSSLQTVTTTCAASWPRRQSRWCCQWGEWPETFGSLFM